MDRWDLDSPAQSSYDFLQQIAGSCGLPSEQEIWEIVWDFAEADKASGSRWEVNCSLHVPERLS